MERMKMEHPEREWQGLGDEQLIDGNRQLRALSRFDLDHQYAIKSETHLWVVMVTHRATDQMLEAFLDPEAGEPMLDAETLAQPPALLCWVCSQPFSQRLRMRKCPGEPR